MHSMPASSGSLCLSAETVEGISVHCRAQHVPSIPAGPFVRLDSGSILSIAGNPAQQAVSRDEGVTWEAMPLRPGDGGVVPAPTGALVKTGEGTVVLAFANTGDKHWTWDDELRDAPGARLPTCVMRSEDGGATWQDPQTLHEDWTGATRDMIQTQSGRIVFTSMKMRHDPGRHTVLCYLSDDDGLTWEPSNVIDLGGNGHHGGVTSSTSAPTGDSCGGPSPPMRAAAGTRMVPPGSPPAALLPC